MEFNKIMEATEKRIERLEWAIKQENIPLNRKRVYSAVFATRAVANRAREAGDYALGEMMDDLADWMFDTAKKKFPNLKDKNRKKA